MFARFRHLRASRQVRPRRERGAAALEFALVAPLFFLVVFGGIELGLMFRSDLTLSDLTRNAARAGSIQRDNPDSDRVILTRIFNQSENLNGDITKIIIYNADSLASEVPADCVNGGSKAGVCNVYITLDGGGSTDLALIAEGFGALANAGYVPDQRKQLTNIGVYVEYEYSFVTGFFDSTTLSSNAIEVIELDL